MLQLPGGRKFCRGGIELLELRSGHIPSFDGTTELRRLPLGLLLRCTWSNQSGHLFSRDILIVWSYSVHAVQLKFISVCVRSVKLRRLYRGELLCHDRALSGDGPV